VKQSSALPPHRSSSPGPFKGAAAIPLKSCARIVRQIAQRLLSANFC